MSPTKTFATARSIFLLLFYIGFLSAASAGTTTITFNDFADTSTLKLNGSAQAVTTADGPVLQLTTAVTNLSGTAFTINPVVLATNGSFSAYFSFRFTPAGGGGADGITFTVQSVGNSALGLSGGGFGYLGVTNSICVEYDTFRNTKFNDPSGNHVGVDFDGDLGGSVYTQVSSLEDGNVWYSWVDYNGEIGSLEVRLSSTNSRPSSPVLTTGVDVMSYLRTTNVYFGFTGSTGANVHQQDVLNWQLTVINPEPPITSDQFIIEAGGYSSSPRVYNGQHETWYSSVGFGHSTATASAPGCTSSIGSDYGTHGFTNPPISSVTLFPQFKVAGGRYLFEAVVPTTSNQSGDVAVSVTSSNGTGLPSSTGMFSSSSVNQWRTIGTLHLTNNATNDAITLTYTSGQIDGTHRWYSAAYRFTYLGEIPPPFPTNPPASFAFAVSSGGTNFQDPFGVAIDNQENIFVSGYYSGTMTFPGTNFASKGLTDMFLAKYDRAGNFLWAKTGGGTTNDIAYAVATDSGGNAYVAGRFGRTATFDGVTLTSAGDEEILLAKYDASGNLVWAKRAGGNSYDFAKKLAVDESGNVYVAGGCRATSTFGTLSIGTFATADAFLAKYDSNGNALWVQHWGSSSGYYCDAHGMARDTNGNMYLTGFYQSTMNVGATSLTNAGGQDIFVMKVDSSGNPIWARRAGGSGNERGLDITADEAGNVFVTGFFDGPGSFGETNFSGDGSDDAFIAKYDASGNFQWAKFGRSLNGDEGHNVKCDSTGNVYLTGLFENVATFSPWGMVSTGNDDAFLAKYDTSGDLLMLRQVGSTNSDWGRALAINGNDSVYWVGGFAGNVTFGDKGLTNFGGMNIFLTRYDEIPPISAANLLVSSNRIVLSWPTNFNGFVLQSSTNLNSSANWSDWPTAPPVANGQYTVTNVISGPTRYFRLRK